MENQDSVLDTLEIMLTRKDIQEHLHIGRDKVNKLIKLKGFPKVQIGKSVVVPKSAYEKWIKDNLKTSIIL